MAMSSSSTLSPCLCDRVLEPSSLPHYSRVCLHELRGQVSTRAPPGASAHTYTLSKERGHDEHTSKEEDLVLSSLDPKIGRPRGESGGFRITKRPVVTENDLLIQE